ncbi:MAG: hypothetical protein OXH20_02235 [bacterium]|nr:hypothetical protein [bacterium]
MLTPLQEQIRAILGDVADEVDLALAAAAAEVARLHPGLDPSGFDI